MVDCRLSDIMWAMLYNYISATHGSIRSVYIILFFVQENILGSKYITVLFCLKDYFGDSFYAPRGLAYTPPPFRPFSHLTTQNSGADR